MALTPTFDISAHDLLSDGADGLNADELAAQTVLAEVLLGLRAVTGLSGTDLENAQLAVVLQVNYQVELGAAPGLLKSEREGDVQHDYNQVGMHPYAQQLASTVLTDVTTAASLKFEPVLKWR